MWKWTHIHRSMHTHTHTHTNTHLHTLLVFYCFRNLGEGVRCVSGLSLTLQTSFPLLPFCLSFIPSISPPHLCTLCFTIISLPSSSLSFSHIGPLSYSFFRLFFFSQSRDLSFFLGLFSFSVFVPSSFYFPLAPILLQVSPSCFCASNSHSLLCFPHSPTINYAQTQCTSLCSPCQIIQFTLARLCIRNDECIDYTIKQGYALRHPKSFCRHSAQIRSSTNIQMQPCICRSAHTRIIHTFSHILPPLLYITASCFNVFSHIHLYSEC